MDYAIIEQLPLSHGGFNLNTNFDLILKNGLVPQDSSNITSIDVAVEKDKYVFLRLARARANYGAGELIIINPQIINLPGVIFYTRDLQGIFYTFRRYFTNQLNDLPDYILDHVYIIKLYNSLKKRIHSDFSNDSKESVNYKVLNELKKSDEFIQYLKLYQKSKKDFYNIFKGLCRKNNCTLKEFYERSPFDRKWDINEEICIPNCINPKYFWGFWNKEKYLEINKPDSQTMQEMLDLYIESLSSQDIKLNV